MPERDTSLRQNGADTPEFTQPIKERAIRSAENDSLVPISEIDEEKPYSPQETARYKAAIAELKTMLDGTEENLKKIAHEIIFAIWPLIKRGSDTFWNHEIAVGEEYLTDYDATIRKMLMYLPDKFSQQEATESRATQESTLLDSDNIPSAPSDRPKTQCVLLVYEPLSDPELVRCTYLLNPADIHNPLKPNWASRESSPRLWLEYADMIVDLLTKPLSDELKAAAQALATRLSKLELPPNTQSRHSGLEPESGAS